MSAQVWLVFSFWLNVAATILGVVNFVSDAESWMLGLATFNAFCALWCLKWIEP